MQNEENTYGFEMANKTASKQVYNSCKEHQTFFKLCQDNAHRKSALRQTNSKVNSLNRSNVTNGDRPAPTLVRVPSRRYQRMGMPDGSEGLDNTFFLIFQIIKWLFCKATTKSELSAHENGFIEAKPSTYGAMSRHNSTPSLMKTVSLGMRYTSPYAQYDSGNNHERLVLLFGFIVCRNDVFVLYCRGLFSKSASASPLSVRSAFVSRYDYGRNNYVSHMKRNSSSLSLQKKNSRVSDNESEVSKCSRSSRHSSRSHRCRHSRGEDSGTESDSSRKRRHRRKHYALQDQPQLVEWNEIQEKRNEPVNGPSMKHSNAVVRNVTSFYGGGGTEQTDLMSRHLKLAYQSIPPERNVYLPSDVQKYINHEPIDSSHLSEIEKKDIKFTNIE